MERLATLVKLKVLYFGGRWCVTCAGYWPRPFESWRAALEFALSIKQAGY